MNAIVSIPVAGAVSSVPLHRQEQAFPNLDARVFALVEEYISAEQRYSDALSVQSRLEEAWAVPLPEVLKIRPRDLELGRKPRFVEEDKYWHRPCDIGQWRSLDEYTFEKSETEDCMTLVQRKVPASPELVARGGEIVAAYDVWSAKRPRGYTKVKREVNRAQRNCDRVRRELCEASATTLASLRAKFRCLEIDGSIDDISGSYAEPIIGSLLRDLRQMTDASV